MSDLKTLILKFAYTLELNWNHLFEPLESGLREDMLEDWLQFHWELFVEYPLAANRGGEVQIRHYASGAETPSGRVFPTDKPLTHEIRFHPIDGDCLTELWDNQPIQFPAAGLPFYRLSSFVPHIQIHDDRPPLNAVQPLGQDDLVFALEQVEFTLAELPCS